MADFRRRMLAILGTGSAIAAVGAPFVPTPVVSVPVGDVIAPAVAVSVIRRILATRSRQVAERKRPARLSPGDSRVLADVVRSAQSLTTMCSTADALEVPVAVSDLLESIEVIDAHPTVVSDTQWSILVRLMGEPSVESRDGVRAVFGKKRATELLSWMVLNRDRLSRVAVRNAMWDFPVADSTFGTILSDLRRGLARLSPAPTSAGWCPATFSDRLVLAEGIVSDIDLLDAALATDDKASLLRELSGVRDTPFAGTTYLWADLDGSTTRIIISVMDAVDRIIEMSRQDGDVASVLVAVRAGLRMMPGDERLLNVQRALLSR